MAKRRQGACLGQKFGGGAVLITQLHKSGTAVQRGGYGLQQGAPLQMAAVGHGVEPQLFGKNFHKKASFVCYHYTAAAAKKQAPLDNPAPKVYHTW